MTRFGITRAARLCVVTVLTCAVAACGGEIKGGSASDPALDLPEWTVMLYFDADDEWLEQDMLFDLNEAELAGSTEDVTVVAQVDRHTEGFDGLGDWTSTKRFLVEQGSSLDRIESTELEDLGEVAMSDGPTLTEFITWAAQEYPAQRYALVMSDHGAGWPGGWSDPDRGPLGEPETMDDEMLLLNEIDVALQAARGEVGIDKLDLVVMDACLMAQLEVFTMLERNAGFAVASEEVVPSMGYAYADWLGRLTAEPGMDGGQLAEAIVEGYINEDTTITDDDTRVEILDEAGIEDIGAETYAEARRQSTTITAVDLSRIGDVNTALDTFVGELGDVDPLVIERSRFYAQHYTPYFGESSSSYVDLANFANFVVALGDGGDQLETATSDLVDAVASSVISERHDGDTVAGSNGIAIHFPPLEVFETSDNYSYADIASAFAEASTWDEYLTDFYAATAPDISPLEMGSVDLTAPTASEQRPVGFSTEIRGDRIGYVYYALGTLDPEQELMHVMDMDYIVADETAEVQGVKYPVWPDSGVNLDFRWDAGLYGIDDGQNVVPALVQPDLYAAPGDTAVYSVVGEYRPSSGEPRLAKLFFTVDGLDKMVTYAGNFSGAAWEVAPRRGDTFQVYDTYISPATAEITYDEGGVLEFSGRRLEVVPVAAELGEYQIGYLAEDLDGHYTYTNTSVEVRN